MFAILRFYYYMTNKILAIIAAILFTVYFATQCILLVDDSNQLIFEIARYASLLFQVIGGSLLYFQGSFRYTLWRRIANFGIAAIFVGTLFRIQHWPGGAIFYECWCCRLSDELYSSFCQKKK